MPIIKGNYISFNNSGWTPEKAGEHITEICEDYEENGFKYFLGDMYAVKFTQFKDFFGEIQFPLILKDDLLIFYVEANVYSGNIGKVIEPNKIIENVLIQSKMGDSIMEHTLRYFPTVYKTNQVAFFREFRICSVCKRKFIHTNHLQKRCDDCRKGEIK